MWRMTSTVAADPCAVVMRKKRVAAVKKVAGRERERQVDGVARRGGAARGQAGERLRRADGDPAAARGVVERRLRGGERDAGVGEHGHAGHAVAGDAGRQRHDQRRVGDEVGADRLSDDRVARDLRSSSARRSRRRSSRRRRPGASDRCRPRPRQPPGVLAAICAAVPRLSCSCSLMERSRGRRCGSAGRRPRRSRR